MPHSVGYFSWLSHENSRLKVEFGVAEPRAEASFEHGEAEKGVARCLPISTNERTSLFWLVFSLLNHIAV